VMLLPIGGYLHSIQEGCQILTDDIAREVLPEVNGLMCRAVDDAITRASTYVVSVLAGWDDFTREAWGVPGEAVLRAWVPGSLDSYMDGKNGANLRAVLGAAPMDDEIRATLRDSYREAWQRRMP